MPREGAAPHYQDKLEPIEEKPDTLSLGTGAVGQTGITVD